MNLIDVLEHIIPEVHHRTCYECQHPVHPWEDKCYFCGAAVNWPAGMKRKHSKPDWFSRIFERATSYKRWTERHLNL